jgi:hypothetical protein
MAPQSQSIRYLKQTVPVWMFLSTHASVVTVQKDNRRLLGKSVQ